MDKKPINSLRGKISLTMIAVVGLTLLCIGALSLYSTNRISRTLTESNQQMSKTSRARSSPR